MDAVADSPADLAQHCAAEENALNAVRVGPGVVGVRRVARVARKVRARPVERRVLARIRAVEAVGDDVLDDVGRARRGSRGGGGAMAFCRGVSDRSDCKSEVGGGGGGFADLAAKMSQK